MNKTNGNSPLVSICIPTYNGAKYLRQALLSAIRQDYRPIEIIISDDNSSDNTLAIATEIKAQTSVPVIIYSHKPSGIGANWNHCIEKANGQYIKFLFQDDLLQPGCITGMMQLALSDPQIALVFCKRHIINELGDANWASGNSDLQEGLKSRLSPVFSGSEFLRGCSQLLDIPRNKIGEPTALLFHKASLVETGGFNKVLKQSLDYELYYRLMAGRMVGYIREPLVSFRLHQGQATMKNKKSRIDEVPLYYWFLYRHLKGHLHPKVAGTIKYRRFLGLVVWLVYKIIR